MNGHPSNSEGTARIVVIGVGGGGSNAVNRMIQANLRGVEFVAVNTDLQALARSDAPTKIRVGEKLTRGLGAGGTPSVGERAAEESIDELQEIVRDADMVFVTAGMGGGTGTGASPVIAQISQEAGALTVGVVTKPFAFEGARRRQNAEDGLKRLREHVHTLITIPNDRLMQVIDRKTTLEQAFLVADDVLRQGIQGISELITEPGLVNLDFADVKSIMSESGAALMAIGHGSGETRAADAARAAISSPLLDISMEGAKGVLLNITGGIDLALAEINEAADIVAQAADRDANIIFGAVIDPRMENEIKITVIATGFDMDLGASFRATARAPLGRQGGSSPRPTEPRFGGRRDTLGGSDRDRGTASADREELPNDQGPLRVGTIGHIDDASANVDDDLDIPPFLRRRR